MDKYDWGRTRAPKKAGKNSLFFIFVDFSTNSTNQRESTKRIQRINESLKFNESSNSLKSFVFSLTYQRLTNNSESGKLKFQLFQGKNSSNQQFQPESVELR